MSSRDDKKAAIARHQAARAELDRVTRTIGKGGEPTDAYRAANSAVIKAEKDIPWWRR